MSTSASTFLWSGTFDGYRLHSLPLVTGPSVSCEWHKNDASCDRTMAEWYRDQCASAGLVPVQCDISSGIYDYSSYGAVKLSGASCELNVPGSMKPDVTFYHSMATLGDFRHQGKTAGYPLCAESGRLASPPPPPPPPPSPPPAASPPPRPPSPRR